MPDASNIGTIPDWEDIREDRKVEQLAKKHTLSAVGQTCQIARPSSWPAAVPVQRRRRPSPPRYRGRRECLFTGNIGRLRDGKGFSYTCGHSRGGSQADIDRACRSTRR